MIGPTLAIIKKEFLDIIRDKVSLFMLIAIPVINLFVVGYSINMDPKGVAAALIDYDKSSFSRTLATGFINTEYFKFHAVETERQAEQLLKKGKVQFLVIIPANFGKDLIAEKKPEIFIQVDATDPAATANALQAAQNLIQTVFNNDIKDINGFNKYNLALVKLNVHKLYNPEGISRFNTVPGLIGVILSIVLTLMSCLSIIRERESGSMIHIINSATGAFEILIGKILPYFCIGMFQGLLIVGLAVGIMGVPLAGSFFSFLMLLALFNILSLSTGVIFSALTQTQLQAMQLSSFYFLLSNMLSGFISPFFGMPDWSQLLGSFLPLTYFLRLARGIMLKSYSLSDMSLDFMMLILITVILSGVSYILFNRMLKQYQ